MAVARTYYRSAGELKWQFLLWCDFAPIRCKQFGDTTALIVGELRPRRNDPVHVSREFRGDYGCL